MPIDTAPLAPRIIEAIDSIVALIDEIEWQEHPEYGQRQIATPEQMKTFDQLDDSICILARRLEVQLPVADGPWQLARQRGFSQLPVWHEWLETIELMDVSDWRERVHRLRSAVVSLEKPVHQKPVSKGRERSRGVSLRDAALIMADEDHRLATAAKNRWQKAPGYKSLHPIGTCPNHKQVKLFQLHAVRDLGEEIEGVKVCRQHQLRQRLGRKARKPR